MKKAPSDKLTPRCVEVIDQRDCKPKSRKTIVAMRYAESQSELFTPDHDLVTWKFK